MNTKMTSAKNDLYKIILTFAILDVITGVLSLIFSTLVWQMLALVITATTLCLSITYCKKYPQNKKIKCWHIGYWLTGLYYGYDISACCGYGNTNPSCNR